MDNAVYGVVSTLIFLSFFLSGARSLTPFKPQRMGHTNRWDRQQQKTERSESSQIFTEIQWIKNISIRHSLCILKHNAKE